jgi:membrane fusion protein, copper/silver efflux system
MKRKLLIIILVGLSAVAAISCQGAKDPSISHYTCPMHPQIKMDNTGQCPICGMDLVPVKKEGEKAKEDHSDHKSSKNSRQIKINPRYVQNIGVLTEKVQKRNLVQVISSYGKIAHDHKLWVAQNEFIEALNLRDKELIKATERKLIFLGLSDKWIETIKKTKSADISLHLETDKMKPRYIEAYVYQEDIGRIKEGLAVKIHDQKSRFLARGTIKAIGTLVNLNSRSVRVLIETDSPLDLKLNTFVQVKINVPMGNRLSIHSKAILFNGDHNMVYVALGEGLFEPKMIQIGDEADPYFEILSGLKDGELVVTNGHFLIDSESQIKFGGSAKHQH